MKYAHTCIRVKDLDASLKFYEDTLGLKEVQRLDYPDYEFTLVYLEDENHKGAQLELTYNYDHEGYDLGDGYGHMAYFTDDLKAEHERIKSLGYEATDLTGLEGDEEPRYFFITDPDGYSIEIINEDYYK